MCLSARSAKAERASRNTSAGPPALVSQLPKLPGASLGFPELPGAKRKSARPARETRSLTAASFAARPTRKTWSRRNCELVRIEAKLKEPRAGSAFARNFRHLAPNCDVFERSQRVPRAPDLKPKESPGKLPRVRRLLSQLSGLLRSP